MMTNKGCSIDIIQVITVTAAQLVRGGHSAIPCKVMPCN